MLWNINFLAVIVAAVVSFILGALWYSPWLFGKTWADTLGLRYENLNPTPKHYVSGIIMAFITAFVLAMLVSWLNIYSAREGVLLGFLIWLGFLATSQYSGVIWANKPLKTYFIDTAFMLINLVVMSTIIAVW